MSEASAAYHEPLERLSERTQNMHRALVSLQEELEAMDWYQQRADAVTDQSLKTILLHNLEEEAEHAAMTLEWLRRNSSMIDQQLRTYLFTDKPITGAEESDTSGQENNGNAATIGSLKMTDANKED